MKTGKRKWHFQMVHHDIWDYDAPMAPNLLDVTVDGKPRKVIAQSSKQGWLYVFDRVTGEPIWPIVETPVLAERSAGRTGVADAADSDASRRPTRSRASSKRTSSTTRRRSRKPR